MTDCIEREDFLKTWCESYCRQKQNCRDDCSFYDAITKFPAADVRENVRSYWKVFRFNDGTTYAHCMNCNITQVFYGGKEPTNFCPNCGADMRGGEKDGWRNS